MTHKLFHITWNEKHEAFVRGIHRNEAKTIALSLHRQSTCVEVEAPVAEEVTL